MKISAGALPVVVLCLMLAACGSQSRRPVIERSESAAVAPSAATKAIPVPQKSTATAKRGGGYYLDDGPGENPPTPEFLAAIPDAEPKFEPLHRFANKPYSVFNREYLPMSAVAPYKAQGVGSWYGRKFHGQRTSSGETYDMFGMTAAHTTLPIPSYARITNPANGKSVVVRVNDRGPFHAGRLIDLSYAAAWKLGYVGSGSTLLEIESILPGSMSLVASAGKQIDPLAELIQRTEQSAPPNPAAPLLPELKESRGIFLQLGAFGNPDNAESFKAHLGRELLGLSGLSGLSGLADGANLSNKLLVQSRAGIYRVQLGPWQDHAEAQRVAEILREAFEIKPVVVRQ